MILAKVVFPLPGGPQRIRDGKKPCLPAGWFVYFALSKSFLITPFSPARCFCPTKPDRVEGLNFSAN